MIDTNKYEGHDLAKGRVGSDYNIYDRKGNIIFDADDVGSNMATLNLLADAPLILAEIKRLHSLLDNIKDIDMNWGIDFNGATITVTHFTGLMLSGELKLEMIE